MSPILTEGFVFVEQPTQSARCPTCFAFIKKGLSPTNDEVFLSSPHQIRLIKIFDGGRTFEKVSTHFRHSCRMAVAA